MFETNVTNFYQIINQTVNRFLLIRLSNTLSEFARVPCEEWTLIFLPNFVRRSWRRWWSGSLPAQWSGPDESRSWLKGSIAGSTAPWSDCACNTRPVKRYLNNITKMYKSSSKSRELKSLETIQHSWKKSEGCQRYFFDSMFIYNVLKVSVIFISLN